MAKMLKDQKGSGWIAALGTIVGGIMHKAIPLINESFGYEVWIPLVTLVFVGVWNEFKGSKK